MNNSSKSVNFYLTIFFSCLACFAYWLIAYKFDRNNSTAVTIIYCAIFLLYIGQMYTSKNRQDLQVSTGFGILFRLVIFFSIPGLSDDFYRFIWDGRLLNAGINPFVNLPTFYVNHPELAPPGIDSILYEKLNSPEYFTIYPPVNQFIFWLSAWLSPQSEIGALLIIRSFILMAEFGNIILIRKLLVVYNLPLKNSLIYILNPLVILELTGNLHFEALVIFFVLLSVYLIKKHKINVAAISFALGICTKLIPLIFLPLLLSKLTVRKSIQFYLVTGIATMVCFLPLLNQEFLEGIQNSFALYFRKFEFNASIYYMLRAYGFYVVNYNIISFAGSFLAMITFVIILHYAFYEALTRRHHLPFTFLWTLFIYLLFTTTLHPWYITPLIAYTLFTNFRFPILWSLLIFFTYLNYKTTGYEESNIIVLMEYGTLVTFLIFESFKNWRTPAIASYNYSNTN